MREPAQPLDESAQASQEDLERDEALITRALVISLVTLVLIGAAVGGTVLVLSREQEPPPVEESPLVLPRLQDRSATPPVVRFVDIAEEAGLEFVHENGATGEKLLPETMGPGCAFLDHDLDGDFDILLVNGARWPHDASGSTEPVPSLALFRNDGTGRFTDVTTEAGLGAVRRYGMGVAVGDYDRDGDPDVFLTAVGANLLLRNDSGRFVDVTEAAAVGGESDAWSTSAGFFDADNDGDLDLLVCNYVRWSREIDLSVDYRLVGVGRAYGPPTNFEGTQPYFYENQGDGTFIEVADVCGFHVRHAATGVPVGKALALVPFDADADGWIDVFVANDTVRNFLFRNLGGLRFEEVGVAAGLAYDAEGRATGAMGVDVAGYRNDEAVAIGVGNFATEMSSFYVAERGELLFNDETITEGIGPVSRQMLSFGLFFFDYDLDGRLDVFQTNGHLEEEIHTVQASQRYEQPSQLFWNCGPGSGGFFVPVDTEATGDLGRPVVGRSAAYADIDADGDLDVLITQCRGRPLLLRNDQATGHHWVRLRLVGRSANLEGIGARVELVAGGARQRREVQPTRSYLAQVEPTLTFGLGSAERVDVVRVRWPGAAGVQELRGLAVDRVHTIEQP